MSIRFITEGAFRGETRGRAISPDMAARHLQSRRRLDIQIE